MEFTLSLSPSLSYLQQPPPHDIWRASEALSPQKDLLSLIHYAGSLVQGEMWVLGNISNALR